MKKKIGYTAGGAHSCTFQRKTKAYIMAGQVYVDGQKEDKAGSMFADTVKVEVREIPFLM